MVWGRGKGRVQETWGEGMSIDVTRCLFMCKENDTLNMI